MQPVSIKNSQHYIWGNNCEGWHLAKSPNLSVIQELIPPNCAEVRHYHQKAEQFFYVLSGTATMEVDGKTHTLTSQQGIHVAAGINHQLRNSHTENLSVIVMSTPPSHGDRITR